MRFSTNLARIAALLALLCPFSTGLAYALQKTDSAAQAAPVPKEKVDINSATLEQLMKVPGMTNTWAARIIRFRPYRAKNDLLDHGVLPGQVYDRIKDNIVAHRVKP